MSNPLVLSNLDQELFLKKCKTFCKTIFEWNLDEYPDFELENSCLKHISQWCDLSKKMIDFAVPEYDFYKKNGMDKTVEQFISKLKELASLPYEERFPKEEIIEEIENNPPPDKEMEKKTHHVDIHNVGEHNPDNSFMLHSSVKDQYDWWKRNNEDCIPIGFCEEAYKITCGFKRIAFVYEDEKGNRYYTHVPEDWKELEFS